MYNSDEEKDAVVKTLDITGDNPKLPRLDYTILIYDVAKSVDWTDEDALEKLHTPVVVFTTNDHMLYHKERRWLLKTQPTNRVMVTEAKQRVGVGRYSRLIGENRYRDIDLAELLHD